MAEISLGGLVLRGRGPVADVFVAAGGRTVVKVYPQPLDRRTFNAVEVEQAKLAGLRSASSIVRVEALDELPDGRTGLRMEYCPQSLSDLVANGPLPVEDVIVLGQILGSVLAEAHHVGLVHGGVTPSNVLERPSGQPALADFGMALRLRFPRDLTSAAAYTAPEVLREGELSEAADVYGLGAVLQLALTGKPPFPARPGESPDDVVLRVLREPPAETTGPPALSALLLRMLAKDPDARPEAAAVVTEFEALLTAGAGTAPATAGAGTAPATAGARTARPTAGAGTTLPTGAAGTTPIATGRSVPLAVVEAPKKAPKPQKAQKQPDARNRGSRAPLLLGAGAAIAIVAVVPFLLRDNADTTADRPASPPPVVNVPTTRITPTPPEPTITLSPPVDKGTSVVLTWSYPKPLTYAVLVAEQGAQTPRTTVVGNRTTLTVPVTGGLKYCFLIQGTDGGRLVHSARVPIRGATCSR
ncbi:serine/threonine-protein kinase [Kribbella sp. NPDC048915]|uniref:serine/threonine-protein kinase n=1 Tax=Kribbella sp. NPDC048915 TaxID=3155148 RepID=UPI0033FB375A